MTLVLLTPISAFFATALDGILLIEIDLPITFEIGTAGTELLVVVVVVVVVVAATVVVVTGTVVVVEATVVVVTGSVVVTGTVMSGGASTNETATGVELPPSLPSPSTPEYFIPQHFTVASASSAHVRELAEITLTTFARRCFSPLF